jgi:hypothetical protein
VIVFDPAAIKSFDEIEPFKARLSNERSPLPLDDFIRTLGDNTSLPILQECGGSRVLFARKATIGALTALLALQAWDEIFDFRTEQLKSLYKLLESLDPQLREAQRLLNRLATGLDKGDSDFKPYRDLYDALNRLLPAIKNAAPLSRRLYADHRRNKGSRWRQAFVGALFEPWVKLTGRKPQPKGLFLGFVDAAWQSLSPDQPDVHFERAIMTEKSKWQERTPPPDRGPSKKRKK